MTVHAGVAGAAGGEIRQLGSSRLVHVHPAAAVASVAVSGYVAICVVFGALGLLLQHQLGAVTRWDDNVVRWFVEHRTTPMNHLTDYATKVADTFGILIVLLVATIVLFDSATAGTRSSWSLRCAWSWAPS